MLVSRESPSMKRRKVVPIARRSAATSIRSGEPDRLKYFVEDPLPAKRDMKAEQEAAFKQPQDLDPRVASSESDQGRTR
jgi:hypothetical protein